MIRSDKIGEGTFGIVYEATDTEINEPIAVKRNLKETQTSFMGALRETDLLCRLNDHPFIIKVEKIIFGDPFVNNQCFSPLVGEDHNEQTNDVIHFAFAKADYDLYSFLELDDKPFYKLKYHMVQLALGLEYIHNNKIIHRDLKPNNILIHEDVFDPFGNMGVAKICDFGLSKYYTKQGKQTPKTITVLYRPPEVALGYPKYSYGVDVWGLACIFFEMIAERPLFFVKHDNDNDILSAIIETLPNRLDDKIMKEFVLSNKWKKVNVRRNVHLKKRHSFEELIGKEAIQFNKNPKDKYDQLFYDLLTKMLDFDWRTRISITQVLEHAFFDDYRDYITKIRATTKVEHVYHKINIAYIIERKWGLTLAINIFNSRKDHSWYTHRILFLAVDLFDRFLYHKFKDLVIDDTMLESEVKGFLYTKKEAQLIFMSCLYISIKFNSTIHYPVTFDDILPVEYKSPESILFVENFEEGFIRDILSFEIYRPTLYETADDYDMLLTDDSVKNLLIFYITQKNIKDMPINELFDLYRFKK